VVCVAVGGTAVSLMSNIDPRVAQVAKLAALKSWKVLHVGTFADVRGSGDEVL
jgi:hypothetical protein